MNVVIRDLEQGDVDALQQLLESLPDYAERATGSPPGPSEALSVLIEAPDGFDPACKRAIGLWNGDRLVAFADVLMGYPNAETAFIGLLAVAGDCHRTGLGRLIHQSVVERARGECNADGNLRLAILDTNKDVAEPFWRSLGYAPTGESVPYQRGTVASTVALWERPIDPGA